MKALNRRFVYRRLTFAAALAATTTAFTPPVVAADLPVKAPPGIADMKSGTDCSGAPHVASPERPASIDVKEDRAFRVPQSLCRR